MTKILATIEARMTSKRLPGKVLKKIMNKYPIIELIYLRVMKSKLINNVCVSTTNKKTDDVLVKFLKKKNIDYFRGEEKNVLKRVIDTAKFYNPEIIVQLTGDNPFLDAEIIDDMIKYFKKKRCNFLTNNAFGVSSNRKFPHGMTVNIFYFKDLVKNYKYCNKKDLKEHTSLYFFREGRKKYKTYNMPIKKKWRKNFLPRLTVDEKLDLKFVNRIFKYFNYKKKNLYFTYKQILDYLERNQYLLKTNSHITQKKFEGIND